MSKQVKLVNVKHGKGQRSGVIYADLYSVDGLEVSATLEYCINAVRDRGWTLVEDQTNDR